MKVKTHILCHVDKSVLWVDKDEANKASMKTQAEMGDRHRPNSVPNSIFFFFFPETQLHSCPSLGLAVLRVSWISITCNQKKPTTILLVAEGIKGPTLGKHTEGTAGIPARGKHHIWLRTLRDSPGGSPGHHGHRVPGPAQPSVRLW